MGLQFVLHPKQYIQCFTYVRYLVLALLEPMETLVRHKVCESLSDGEPFAVWGLQRLLSSRACTPLLHPQPPLLKASAVLPRQHFSRWHHYVSCDATTVFPSPQEIDWMSQPVLKSECMQQKA